MLAASCAYRPSRSRPYLHLPSSNGIDASESGAQLRPNRQPRRLRLSLASKKDAKTGLRRRRGRDAWRNVQIIVATAKERGNLRKRHSRRIYQQARRYVRRDSSARRRVNLCKWQMKQNGCRFSNFFFPRIGERNLNLPLSFEWKHVLHWLRSILNNIRCRCP